MTDLSVDVTGLRTLARTIRSVRTTLHDSGSDVGAARDAVGDDRVEDALRDFEHLWDDGRRQIDENVETVGGLLDESAAAFERTDADLALAARPTDDR